MRVLFIVGSLGAGGLERFVTRVSLRAKELQDFEPAVLCVSERSGLFVAELERAGVPIFSAPEGWPRSRAGIRSLADVMRAARADLIHSQVNFSLWQQFSAARKAGARAFCVTERNCYPLSGMARFRRILQFHLLRRLGARYTANGKAVAAHLARMVFVRTESIGVLPNGVPIPPERPEARRTIREELGWHDEDMGIGYISRMAAHKGQLLFLQAIRSAKDRGLPVRACLVGDGPERPRVEALVQEYGLKSHVALTGVVPNVDEYLEAFDAVALMSSREGMPNALLEAMAAGKPILATKVGANAEILADGRAGVLLDTPDPVLALNEIERLARNPGERLALGSAARERAATVYSIEASYARLVNHYKEAMRN